MHSASQQLVDIELLLLVHKAAHSPSDSAASNSTSHQHYIKTQSPAATSTPEQRPAVQVYPSEAIWSRLLSNQSSVFLHVLLVASSDTGTCSLICYHSPAVTDLLRSL